MSPPAAPPALAAARARFVIAVLPSRLTMAMAAATRFTTVARSVARIQRLVHALARSAGRQG